MSPRASRPHCATTRRRSRCRCFRHSKTPTSIASSTSCSRVSRNVPRLMPVAVLGLGTATFLDRYGIAAGPPPGDALVAAACEAGITYYDTAAAYGDGEAILGRT